MKKRSAQRIDQVQDPVIPIVANLIAENPGTISLGQGIVHYDPPLQALEAAASQMLDPAVHRYGGVAGNSDLQIRIASKLEKENGIAADRGAVVYTAGSNMAFLNAVLAIADVGDEVILQSPFYFNHQMAIEIAGCKSVEVSTTADYQLDLVAVENAINDRTRAIVTVSPNNPTGAVYSQADLVAVNELCARHGIFHISDEAYEYFVYEEAEHFSPASIPGAQKHTISLYTFSKAYGMAGWRCGYMLIPSDLLPAVHKIQDTNLVCPPILNQHVASEVLNVGSGWCREQVAEFARVRNAVLEELSELSGCRIPLPQGAFYMLLQLDTHRSDTELVEELIRRYGVATLPGSAFGVDEGSWLRISYGALESETVIQGIDRLKSGLKALL
ncbi:MAG: pyridoxal phosphate-dependent aminotransferase [Planctomycetota bacterium]